MSAAESTVVTSLRRSAPSFGGIRVSLGNGEASMMSPTAAIVIASALRGVGVASTFVSAIALGVVSSRVWQDIVRTQMLKIRGTNLGIQLGALSAGNSDAF